MSEPSLFAQSADKELHVYRFLWLRTFDRPVVVRLSIRQDGGGSITTKITNGTGGNRPGKIITDKTIEIGKAEIQRALELANAAGFWSMKTEEGSLGKDGAEWIVEGIRLGQYHIAERWSPNTGGYRELCLYLLKLGEVEEKEVY